MKEKYISELIEKEAQKSENDIDGDFISLCLDVIGVPSPDEKTVSDETNKIILMSRGNRSDSENIGIKKFRSAGRILLIAAAVAVMSSFIVVGSISAVYHDEITDTGLIAFIESKLNLAGSPESDTRDKSEDTNPYRKLFSYVHLLPYNIGMLEKDGFHDIKLPEIVREENMRSTDVVFFDEKNYRKGEFWLSDSSTYVTVRIRRLSGDKTHFPDISRLRGSKAERIYSENAEVFIWHERNERVMLEYIIGENYYKISADISYDEMKKEAVKLLVDLSKQ